MKKQKVWVYVEDPYISAYVFSSREAAEKALPRTSRSYGEDFVKEQEIDPEEVYDG